MSKETSKNVVIVGGGFAGTAIATAISAKLDSAKFNLILVTARPYFVHLPACIRMSVTAENKLEDSALIPYDNIFVNGKGKLTVAEVVSIEDQGEAGGNLKLSNGETLQYSILVLAPGNTWEGPLAMPKTKDETVKWISEWRHKFEEAKEITLVGGGAVGSEFAGEIRQFLPSKNVTLVHNEKLLMNSAYPDRWRSTLTNRIKDIGVNLILGDQLEESEGTEVHTRNGKTIKSDLIVFCRGGRPNTGFISSLGEDVLTSSGRVKVNPSLQVVNHPRIFAAGDVIEWKEQKQSMKTMGHAPIVAQNVLALTNAQPASASYKNGSEIIVVTIGSKAGSAYLGILWGVILGNWFAVMIKAKDLLISGQRKALGFKA